MNWFQNSPTRIKLLSGFGVMVVLLGIVFGTSYYAITSLIGSERTLFDTRFSDVVDAITFEANEGDIRIASLMMLNQTNAAEIQRLNTTIGDESKEAELLLRRLMEQNQSNTNILQLLQEWGDIRDAYKKTREEEVVPAMEQGRLEQARNLLLGVQAERFQKMREITSKLMSESRTEAQDAIGQAEGLGRHLLWSAAGVGLLALVAGFVMVGYLNRLIALPLRQLLLWTEKATMGDLSITAPPNPRRDEVGALHEGFRRMLESLRSLNREIQESVNVLAAAASQILAATSEMAASASETATASAQTTATVEEVKQTAQVSSAKSRQVAEIARQAARDSEAGRKSVEEGIEGMNRVRSQMEAIAESIVRLSEQSQAIGEIIASVNDLAEQSNLLAVNASIEAAKAGEHGKGFAVVAQEIRNLAAQSKQATAQVRGILGDIQKATSSAAMVTEQGGKAVETGVRQSADAGEAIRALAESINQAAEAAQQISASSEQQSVGMDQVAAAMESIKRATNQNANATKQVDSGARNLHEIGQNLKQLVGRFRM